MKLEYLENINDYADNIVRLYDFDKLQADKFRQAIRLTIIENNKLLDLTALDFIVSINCNLTLRLTDNDIGISTKDKINFFCDLTKKGYEEMILLLEPFCTKESSGYQWLYDIDTPTEFLFSPTGKW